LIRIGKTLFHFAVIHATVSGRRAEGVAWNHTKILNLLSETTILNLL
jgi:hypothetical protein